jgi:putative hydrolase of the HAD superfamily
VISSELLTGVTLLCLDAGNTVIFLDHARLAGIAREAGVEVTADALVASEGRAKRLAETGGLADPSWSKVAPGANRPGARSWGRMCATILREAGASSHAIPEVLERLWESHERRNLWSSVPAGLREALRAFRGVGGRVAIVSNSEGMLDALFAELGILDHFDVVIDSAKVGFEKPDPRIFEHALGHFGARPDEALHLGDMYATDVVGARAAGIRVALVDPFGHYADAHPDVPRVPGAPEVLHALFELRSLDDSIHSKK